MLKGHTRNRAGTVTLRSADPLDTPAINFNYFTDGGDADLNAVVEGIRFVRRVTRTLRERGVVAREELPGDEIVGDAELAEFVRRERLGAPRLRHLRDRLARKRTASWTATSASTARGTCGSSMPPSSRAFLASSFVSAVYMIAEKAADVILADAAQRTRKRARIQLSQIPTLL